ncbi:PQQ-binding-like beta-propeller repeat protein [Streptomyces sp. NPDC058052]|uniref:outer membrane protein assembly factor BamB family protein n=1 Tax=Streptomyces sp. NPDC058052 TaxID=3346316 RepID=UPI0036EF3078
MTGLRRTAGAVAVTLGSAALGSALVLLAGLVYQLVDGDVTGGLVAWTLGLVVVAALFFGVFGGTLPDDATPRPATEAETAAERTGDPAAGDGAGDVADGPDGGPGKGPDGGSDSGSDGGSDGDWYDALVFGLVVLGLVAGGPFGIAGYEALRPAAGTVSAPAAPGAPSPSAPPSASAPVPAPASAAPSASASASASTPAVPREPGEAAVAWTVRPAGGPYDTAPGAWGAGDAVVHVRTDGLTAYAARDGAVRWNVPAPRREAVCAMSEDTGGKIGLVAFGRHEKPCATLLAVHTSTGKVLWRQRTGGTGVAPYGLAVAGSTAVAAEDRAVRGRSAESGEERWRRPLGRGCAIRALGADEDRALLVEQCGTGARLVALETRTGEERWTRPLPVESRAAAAVVSATPPVVAVNEEDPRGTNAVLAFDERGTPTATVPVFGPAGTLVVPEQVAETGQSGRAVVAGGRLVVLAAEGSSRARKVVALSLEDGRPAWEHAPEGSGVEALAPEADGRVAVLFAHRGTDIALLDAVTGAPRGGTVTEDPAAIVSGDPVLLPVDGAHVVVGRRASAPHPALFALPLR